MAQLRALPSYRWCSDDPAGLSLPELPQRPPIPELLTETPTRAFPRVAPDAAGATERLVALANPRIRLLSAYWHSGWPDAVVQTWLRSGAADRLELAAESLPAGFGLAVWDAWRDPELQRSLHEVAYRDGNLAPGFVNPPSVDPGTPPPHATGGTVDLTLTWLGRPLSLGTEFDEFVDLARSRSLESVADSQGFPTVLRDLRRMLRTAMLDAGFVQLDCEWWHFEYGTRLWAAVHSTAPLYPAAVKPH